MTSTAAATAKTNGRVCWEVLQHCRNGRFIVAIYIDGRICDYQLMTADEVEAVFAGGL